MVAVDEGGKEEEGEGRSRGKERGLPSPLFPLLFPLSTVLAGSSVVVLVDLGEEEEEEEEGGGEGEQRLEELKRRNEEWTGAKGARSRKEGEDREGERSALKPLLFPPFVA